MVKRSKVMCAFMMRRHLLWFMGCNVKKFLGLSLFIFCRFTWAAPCPIGQSKDGSALVHIEQTWASTLEKKDDATLGCLLAEEFQDVDPQGNISDRATTLAKAADHRPTHNELSELTPRVYGDFGYIRGLATATDAQGKIMARVRFTDVYVYRDGRWQAVAGQESMLPTP
jgi:hypothetical protein